MAPLRSDLTQLIGFFFVAMVLSNLALTLITMLIKSFKWWGWNPNTGRFTEDD